MTIYADNSYSIGNTPLVRLKHFGHNGNVVVKIEGRNPSFSVKCRIGANMIWQAEKDGILTAGKEIVDATSGNTGIALAYVAANPVDVLTYSTWKFSGFPKERVIGSGTSLDSARFRQALAEKIGIDARSVHAYIMGEHGDSEFAVWSHANVAGVKLEQWLQANRDLNEQDLVDLFISVRDAAYSIINKKGATYYGIAVALARITKAILDDENAVLPLSVFQEGQYGVENVFIGQPAIVGAHGIVRPVNIPLNDAETQKMQASAKELQAIIDEAWKNPEFQEASKN